MSLAGCSCGVLSAVKLCQSSSISGPSEIANPIEEKTLIICSSINAKGCLEPRLLVLTLLVKSIIELEVSLFFSKENDESFDFAKF